MWLLGALAGCASGQGGDAAAIASAGMIAPPAAPASTAGFPAVLTAGASTPPANMPTAISAGAQAAASGSGFEVSVQPFINMACNCHQSEPLMAPFSLKPGDAYKNMVNVPSSQLMRMLIVKPGSTQDSYLWHKINNTHLDVGGSGQVMPSNIPLNADEKKIFERWILGGAQR